MPEEKAEQARDALPILVRQAHAGQTLFYSELASEMGIHWRPLRHPLEAIGQELRNLEGRWGRPVPPIQALVVNKDTGLPGEGFAQFVPDEQAFKRATRRERRRIVDSILKDVFNYPDWDQVLREFGLRPARLELPPADEITAHEGIEHRKLKEAVSKNPQWIGLSKRLSPGQLEANLRSGDSIDVLFSDANRRIAVEVKGASAPDNEVIRGLFQCVKYEAVLDAEARVTGSCADCEAVLALGGSLPAKLTPLRHTLGVRVFENVGSGKRDDG